MERLNKYLAGAGVASRRGADQLIIQHRVKVNGLIVEGPGLQIDPAVDTVTVDEKPIGQGSDKVYLILHKPKGYLSTVRDPFGRPTVMELLPQTNARLYPVGRLDLDTSGLLFFSNDGELALALTHPRHLVEKVYRAKVNGVPTDAQLQQLTEGIELEDGMTAPAKLALETIETGNAIVRVNLREGRKRQVKRMFGAIGHPVLELQRIAMGPLQLGELMIGQCRYPTQKELLELMGIKSQIANELGKHGDENVSKGENPV